MKFAPQGGSSIVFTDLTRKKARQQRDSDVEKRLPVSLSGSEESSRQSSKAFKIDALGKEDYGGPALTWKNLSVNIGKKQILKNITAFVRPGDFVALCGTTGAGKTTLLSALSQINFAGDLSGEIHFGKGPLGRAFKKATGFAQQQDLHDGTATVREALEFSALLRQSTIYSKRERLNYVERVLDLLDLRKIQNALIGDDTSGLGPEQTKRVTIAVELAARPKILFADEPTSGLDSQGAAHIVHYLRILSDNGQAVVVTIHQPSASLFNQFDRLLALSSEGQQLYFGEIDHVLQYFEQHGAVCPADANPAEFVLETVGAGMDARHDSRGADWARAWSESPEAEEVDEDIALINTQSPSLSDFEDNTDCEFNATLGEQTRLLTIRKLKHQWRSVSYIYSKLWVHVIAALLVGFTIFQAGTSPTDLQNRAFSVFFILFLANAIINPILAHFFFARQFWEVREGPTRTYGWLAMCNASILAELPGALICGVLYYSIFYFASGLPSGQSAGYVFLAIVIYEIYQVHSHPSPFHPPALLDCGFSISLPLPSQAFPNFWADVLCRSSLASSSQHSPHRSPSLATPLSSSLRQRTGSTESSFLMRKYRLSGATLYIISRRSHTSWVALSPPSPKICPSIAKRMTLLLFFRHRI